jgi:hypothetical protein
MIWIISYLDEFGTPRVKRIQLSCTWKDIVQIACDQAGQNKWSVTRIEVIKKVL